MSKRDDSLTLRQMLDACRKAMRYSTRIGTGDDLADAAFQEATIRQIEVLGEASARLSAAFVGAHPAWPWRSMKAMRNRLIHGYDSVDIDDVLATVRD